MTAAKFRRRISTSAIGLFVLIAAISVGAQQGSYVSPAAASGGLPTGLTYAAPTFTVSSAGAGNGVLALSGNTSGTATITAPAVAGTATNAIAFSNVLLTNTDGTCANPAYILTGIGGMAGNLNGSSLDFCVGGADYLWMVGSNVNVNGTKAFGYTDAAISRDAANVVDVGNGTVGDKTGQLNAAVINPTSTTVAALPAAAAGNKGWMKVVSDSTAVATEGQTCAGSSTNTALAFSNGTVWKCF